MSFSFIPISIVLAALILSINLTIKTVGTMMARSMDAESRVIEEMMREHNVKPSGHFRQRHAR